MNDSSTDYRVLLATVDLGELAEQVVARSADRGRRCGASVELANILENPSASLIGALSSGELQEIRDKATRWSQTPLGELKARTPGARATHTCSGVPADEISALVMQIDADLFEDGIRHRVSCDLLVVRQPDGV